MTEKQLSRLGSNVGFLGWLQKVGNKLPDPFMLFTTFSIIVIIISFFCAKSGMSVTYFVPQTDGTLKETTVAAVNLLSKTYFQGILKDFTKIYATFLPLGMTVIFVMGIGYMQSLGFFDAFMKRCLAGISPKWVTFMVALIGVNGNIASSGGVIMATTLGAAIFSSLKRNPILGGIVGYVASHGGFTANFMVSGEDALCASITKTVCDAMGIQAVANPLMNYYFTFMMTIVMALIVTFVTEVIMPKFVDMTSGHASLDAENALILTEQERRGLRGAALGSIVYIALLLITTIPETGLMRNPTTGGILPSSPLLDGVIPIIFFLFIFAGTGYGIASKKLTKMSQVSKCMALGVSDSVSYIVVCLPASFFIHFFNSSKLTTIIAVNGADFLKAANFTGIPLAVAFVLFCTFVNLFMTSNSAKWMILAPIFVPMFAAVGLSPALTQIAYRIGDTCTNPITPINYFIPLAIAVMEQYRDKENDPEIGFGTVISMTFPYSMTFLVVLILILIMWMLLGLPVGPGAAIYMPAVNF